MFQQYEKCYKSWSGLTLTRSGPRPAQYLEDGETGEALERGEREPTLGERETATKLGEKETLSFFLIDVIFPLLCSSSFPNPIGFRFWILSIYLYLVIII